MNTSLCEVRNVHHTYGSRTVLDIDSFYIKPGSITGITGPNGCGKSTLLRMLAFLEKPDRGVVLFNGAEHDIRPNPVHREVCLLGQEPYLLKRSVRANVGYGLNVRNTDDIEPRIREALHMVGLDADDFLRRMWHELSGGETQRVALAARLVLRPKLLLLDEPTANLDEKSSTTIRTAVEQIRKTDGTSLVIVSHDLRWLRSICSPLIIMERGEMVETA